MRKICLALLVVCFFANSVWASVDPELVAYQLSAEKTHFTFGVGIATDLIGGIVKNGMGEPKNSFALNTVLGFSYTTYYGANSVDTIFLTSRQSSLEAADNWALSKKVREKLQKNTFTFFRVGTAFLIYPLVLQSGFCWLPHPNTRFEIGLGLPVLLNFGFNLDF
ncbi:hypothetical protein A2276_07070 [candidate division WOR-1 bacterium RIFOXYA12_FULL_43_27]|uniref:Outer membrane protein beta-barrel domain-containing protein n=1 Tax=candidate division WOR-1 bacterium RIFOXYC2_FULL_46_14 TaxID=1802587 RepID=A0A1F4U3F1_UNCSA|nr:MAG: hypothetical protein A2276_07070 [candidate division WOR-1 bacterium RIFOXYA12_FULL_43_27]OGC18847.1 MAG: hypothetical protein A2292_07925 [candidate division WOR-1 bacterium RIFOXYB2_FULL_46_45]OGC28988.1 MAG: hypothetical protein A2232_02990 [candidate division WOR-1 bacterium RIFOXYA2_FULL_46_56]OGC39370.1 MAG: hypothetical protein A2438_06605 [candidate division WOR-1 bacterium RIFOXYC2_FULL_46_14]